MSDALKFAFEILVVGALALPWLAVLYRMFPPDRASGLPFDLSIVPQAAQGAIAAALLIAFGYFLGSAVSRVSRDIFNDELFGYLPTEARIREAVYRQEYCKEHVMKNLALPFKPDASLAHSFAFCPGTVQNDTPEKFSERIDDLFQFQENALLLMGADKVDRLKQFYDQINVLRGAAFNGMILCGLCLFGCFRNVRGRWTKSRLLQAITFVPPAALVVYGAYTLCMNHWIHPAQSIYSDPPLAETVLLLLGSGGLFVVWKAREAKSYLRMCVAAAVLTLISFGGYWWTEVMYDLQVIHSQPKLTGHLPTEDSPSTD